ncbi:UDP-N-acetylmuramoyl-L-alanine--D-glutamate ligase [Halothiobacillus sp.]|uniref:UDP-N-acetylmuramoyl-L-alanine--D-glutamate ligase n=1 Tax=Halothiobacillus sp. TaxID=1891311 RepID=UPI002627FCC4|nr:UDP-N-acetylmuramoyl-L-alanine--D-glutamate ligase [Halothiobacillus sp.]MDD4965448.1 UDP-N-acetylmuramoyl-L-alanine--D-glutamate ligase [Halothiobacillus sp.]
MEKHSLILGMGTSGQSVARHLSRLGLPFAAADTRDDAALRADWLAQYPEVCVTMGALPESLLDNVAELIVSPGIALDLPLIMSARAKEIPVRGDIDLALHATDLPVVLITGSNGKSTVTALVGELLNAVGVSAAVGGNFGTPALDLLAAGAQVLVLEVSSFQLESTDFDSLPAAQMPVAASVLNISQDHLDRHGTLAHYAAIKQTVLHKACRAILNRDDPLVAAMAERASGEVIRFGTATPTQPGDFGLMTIAGESWLVQAVANAPALRILPVHELALAGQHNQMNVLAALALVQAAVPGVALTDERLLNVLRTFSGLPHRAQTVGVIDGVRYIDDSKATNVGAAVAAIVGMQPPLVLIAGGQGKGQDFTALAESLVGRCAGVVLLGQDQAVIAEALLNQPGAAWPVRRVNSMIEAVKAASEIAPPQSTVLLAPACASLDMFVSYVDRGHQFAAAVAALAATHTRGTEVAS